ncbi:MAG: zinc-ribbon domain-containing protein [Calditrichaeota bacterium]|nr:zinc-ribbon domain-containing protein [Calditrichota bacterium]
MIKDQKKCPSCGAVNDKKAKFCVKCGTALPEAPDGIKCKSCGTLNDLASRFCKNCGNPLKGKTKGKTKQKQAAKKTNTPLIAGFVVLGLILMYLVFQDMGASRGSDPSQLEQVSNNAVLEAKVREVASEFVCACGSCEEEALVDCECPTAQQERNFIRQKLQSGQSKEAVVKAVKERFGWAKSDMKVSKKINPAANLPDVLSNPNSQTSGKILASLQDRPRIIAQFECPCGQCDIDELKDCSCEHPKGAKEVKGFIDRKIAEGRFTPNEIVGLVETVYGHRK